MTGTAVSCWGKHRFPQPREKPRALGEELRRHPDGHLAHRVQGEEPERVQVVLPPDAPQERTPDGGRDHPAVPEPVDLAGRPERPDGGRERERFSDPDASWGHCSAVSTRKGGGFYGFRLHAAVCSVTGLPLAWEVQTARQHESLSVEPLLTALASRGIVPATAALDKGYDAGFVYDACESRGIAPIIPVKQTEFVKRGDQVALSNQRVRAEVDLAESVAPASADPARDEALAFPLPWPRCRRAGVRTAEE